MMDLRIVKYVYGFGESVLDNLQCVYLNCWTAYQPMNHLIEAYTIAAQLGALSRAPTWHQILMDKTKRGLMM